MEKLNDQYDLIFIDADKPGYISYVEIILKRDLLVPGGFIVADNVGSQPVRIGAFADRKTGALP